MTLQAYFETGFPDVIDLTQLFTKQYPNRPYSPGGSSIALSEPLGLLYTGKLLDLADGEWRFMAFRGDGDRDFLGELTDPWPIEVSPAGDIVVRTGATPRERDDVLGPP